MNFAGLDMDSIYNDIALEIINNGSIVQSHTALTKEICNIQLQLFDPRRRFITLKARDMDMRYCVGELCHFLDGRRDLASIAHYSKFWKKVSDDGKTINSAYGYRIFRQKNYADRTQFGHAIQCLKDEATSRRAVIMIHNTEDAKQTKDEPCTIFLQLLIRNNRLHLFANMRSQDIWLGVPYDIAFFTLVQEIAFVILKQVYRHLLLGAYYHNVTSLHAYERDLDALSLVAESRPVTNTLMLPNAPALTSDDIDTWFNDLITYEKASRGIVTYKYESTTTRFQDWCKKFI